MAYLPTCLRSHTLTLHPVPAHPPSGSPPSACTPALAPQMTCQRCSCAASSGVQCAKVQWQNIIAGNGLIQGISRVVSTAAAGVLCALAVPPITMKTLGGRSMGLQRIRFSITSATRVLWQLLSTPSGAFAHAFCNCKLDGNVAGQPSPLPPPPSYPAPSCSRRPSSRKRCTPT